MSFLEGRFISDPDLEDLPDPETLEYRLYTHDVGKISPCDINENRYTLDNFYDKEDDKLYKQIYCWKGIIKKTPDCTIGTVCDPHSYTNARTRFCLSWGCKDPHLFVADLSGEAVVNERGGVIVFNQKEKCVGGFLNQVNCFVGGMRQSLDHILDPANRKQLLIQTVILSVVVTISLIILLRFRGSKNKRIVKWRKAITPRFSKTQPLFKRR
jgi:hypothetical protein